MKPEPLKRLEYLKERIQTQFFEITPTMREEEKRDAEIWNPILKNWAKELEKIENEFKLLVQGLLEKIEKKKREAEKNVDYDYVNACEDCINLIKKWFKDVVE